MKYAPSTPIFVEEKKPNCVKRLRKKHKLKSTIIVDFNRILVFSKMVMVFFRIWHLILH